MHCRPDECVIPVHQQHPGHIRCVNPHNTYLGPCNEHLGLHLLYALIFLGYVLLNNVHFNMITHHMQSFIEFLQMVKIANYIVTAVIILRIIYVILIL